MKFWAPSCLLLQLQPDMFLEDKILALTFNLSTFYTVPDESEEYNDATGNQSQSMYHASSCCCGVFEQCRLWGHERFLFWLRQYGMHDPPTILLLEAVRVVFVKGKLRIPVSFMTSLVMIVMSSESWTPKTLHKWWVQQTMTDARMWTYCTLQYSIAACLHSSFHPCSKTR